MADDSPEAPARALERAGKLKKQQQQQEDVAVDVAALEERTTATIRALFAAAVQL